MTATANSLICEVCSELIEDGFDEAIELGVNEFAHDSHSTAELNEWSANNPPKFTSPE